MAVDDGDAGVPRREAEGEAVVVVDDEASAEDAEDNDDGDDDDENDENDDDADDDDNNDDDDDGDDVAVKGEEEEEEEEEALPELVDADDDEDAMFPEDEDGAASSEASSSSDDNDLGGEAGAPPAASTPEDAAVAHFVAITGAARDEARSFLELGGWDVETAVQLYFIDDHAGAGPALGEDLFEYLARNRHHAAAAAARGSIMNAGADDDDDDPEEEDDDDDDVDDDDEDDGARGDGDAQVGLVRRTWRCLVSLLATAKSPLGREAALEFVRGYELTYGARPPFFVDRYVEAASSAMRQSKMLLVYLHSSLHEATDRFCRVVLADPAFVAFVSRTCVLWAADVRHAEGYDLAASLGVTRFPFFAVLICRRDGQQVVDRLQGVGDDGGGPGGGGDAGALVARLSSSIGLHDRQLERMRREQQARTESSRLRAEQDSEYERALEEDRRREERQAAERAALEVEAAQAEQAAALAAALEASRRTEREATLKRKRANVGIEPGPGLEAARLRLQFPNGSKVDRRFDAHARLATVRDFVDCFLNDSDVHLPNYSLNTNYPRKIYDDDDLTLAEADLNGKVLYVHDLDA